MDRTSVDWHGPMVAVITPFDDDGNIDEANFSSNLQRMFDNRATGIVVGGCTGNSGRFRTMNDVDCLA